MYVSLYSRKQLQQTKQFMLLAGIFLTIGGGYAFIRELFILDDVRFGWAIASIILLAIGLLWGLVGKDKIRLKDAYFSMTADRISYRMAVLNKEKVLLWNNIDSLDISENTVRFHLKTGKTIAMRLGNIQQPEVALHVSRSIQIAALEKGVMVNGVLPATNTPAVNA